MQLVGCVLGVAIRLTPRISWPLLVGDLASDRPFSSLMAQCMHLPTSVLIKVPLLAYINSTIASCAGGTTATYTAAAAHRRPTALGGH